MAKLEWHACVEALTPHVAKISTPRGHGTGFLFSYSGGLCAIATADHVVSETAEWEEPVRIESQGGRRVFLRPERRAIVRLESQDTAAIVFKTRGELFPAAPLALIGETEGVKIGVEIGWLGFPGIAPTNLCFFLGRVSSHLVSERSYLVDGVAINGVSGGPAFTSIGGKVVILGIVSAYRPNFQASGALPGLCVVRHVAGLHEMVRQLQNLDDAKKKQETPSNPAPAKEPQAGQGLSNEEDK